MNKVIFPMEREVQKIYICMNDFILYTNREFPTSGVPKRLQVPWVGHAITVVPMVQWHASPHVTSNVVTNSLPNLGTPLVIKY